MLVFTRKVSEKVLIGGSGAGQLYVKDGDRFVPVKPISVMVCDHQNGDRVKLGIEADRIVPVHRGEIHRKAEQNAGARCA